MIKFNKKKIFLNKKKKTNSTKINDMTVYNLNKYTFSH